MLAAGGPYPLVVLPVGGEYWLEGSNHSYFTSTDYRAIDCKIEMNNVIQSYRRDFMGKVPHLISRVFIKNLSNRRIIMKE